MPHIGVALRLQMVMADHHVVDILNLEGLVIEAVLFALNAEEDAVVDKGLAGVCGGSSTTPISRITLASFTNILAFAETTDFAHINKPRREANGGAQCEKSARCVATRRGLETWHGRDTGTLADERASQQGKQTSA